MSMPRVCSVIFAFATVLEPMAPHGSPWAATTKDVFRTQPENPAPSRHRQVRPVRHDGSGRLLRRCVPLALRSARTGSRIPPYWCQPLPPFPDARNLVRILPTRSIHAPDHNAPFSPCRTGLPRINPQSEMWPSGRRHTPAKGADGEPSRGFESLRLRHLPPTKEFSRPD